MRRLALLAWARAFFRRHLRVRWIRSSQTPLPCSSDKVLTAAPALARPLTVCGETYAPYCFVAIVALFLMSSSPASGQSRTPEITSETILTATLTPEAPLVTGSFDDLSSPIWRRALHVSSFANYTTHRALLEKTEAYLIFGPDAIYYAVVGASRSRYCFANGKRIFL